MRFSTLLSTICLTLFYALPTLAITEGKAWVNFYKDCPGEVVEIDRLTIIMAPLNQSSEAREKSVASSSPSSSIRAARSSSSPSTFAMPSSSSLIPRISSSSSFRLLSSSSIPNVSSSSSIPHIPLSTSSNGSKRSKFRSALAARKMEDTESTMIRSPSVNITQGQCVPVPIVTSTHIDSRSVSIEAELLSGMLFQDCNITVHEVPWCIDPPLIVAPVNNREAKSECKRRNFDAYSDVWVKLDCSEVGTGTTGFNPSQSMVARSRPIRRTSQGKKSQCTFPNFSCRRPSDP